MSRKPSGYWNNYENCYEAAKNCKSRADFGTYNAAAYSAARKNGWIEDYTWFISYSKPSGYWNEEHCLEEAKKYTSLLEFKRNSSTAYNVSRKNKWIDSYTWLQRKIAKSGFWENHDNCLNESKKYKTRTEFSKGNNSAYVQSLKNGWIDEFFPKTD